MNNLDVIVTVLWQAHISTLPDAQPIQSRTL